jgi:hypothetical protein
MGLIDTDAVVAWADHLIASRDRSPMQVMDVALAGRRPVIEVIDLLGTVPGDGNLAAAAHWALGLLLQQFLAGRVPLERAVDMLWAYSNWAAVPEDERQRAGNFTDALFCAQRGYCGTLDSVRAEVEAFLLEHATHGARA